MGSGRSGRRAGGRRGPQGRGTAGARDSGHAGLRSSLMDTVVAYGHWPSPLSAAQAAAGKVSLSEVASDGTSVYWLESRPAEGGRVVFVRARRERRRTGPVRAWWT